MEDKFRTRIGDFIGLVIPGALFLVNFIVLFRIEIINSIRYYFHKLDFTIPENIIIFIVFLIFSYIIGSLMRLFDHDSLDWLSSRIRNVYEYYMRGLNRLLPKNEDPIVDYPLTGYKEKFPYFHWYVTSCIKSMPDIASFYENKYDKKFVTPKEIAAFPIITKSIWFLLIIELVLILLYAEGIWLIVTLGLAIVTFFLISLFIGSPRSETAVEMDRKWEYPDKFNYRRYFNYCKLSIAKSEFQEEVLFAEGLSRMVIGISYSTFISIIVMIAKVTYEQTNVVEGVYYLLFNNHTDMVLFVVNFLLFFRFLWSVHHVRVREAITVFTAYAIQNK